MAIEKKTNKNIGKTLAQKLDPENKVDETSSYTNKERGQFEYWEVDDEGNKEIKLISNIYYPDEDGYAVFEYALEMLEQLEYYSINGFMDNFTPGEEKPIYDIDGEAVDTYFEEFWFH